MFSKDLESTLVNVIFILFISLVFSHRNAFMQWRKHGIPNVLSVLHARNLLVQMHFILKKVNHTVPKVILLFFLLLASRSIRFFQIIDVCFNRNALAANFRSNPATNISKQWAVPIMLNVSIVRSVCY